MLQKLRNKVFPVGRHGQLTLGDTSNAVVIFGTIVITLAVIALVVGGVQDQTTAGTAEFNVSQDGLTGLQNMGDFLPVVGLVIIAAVIIGLLVFFRRGG
jgi:hypothetical protein